MRFRSAHTILLSAFALGASAFLAGSLAHPTPAAAYTDSKLAGAQVFTASGCAHCHGANGEGTEKGPNLHNLRKKASAEKVREQIVHGGGAMPAFGDVLQPEQITQLVDFLRAKRWITPPASSEAPPATPPAASAR